MAACTFFGHRECYGLDSQVIENLINNGVDTFYVGNQGQFDSAVYSCLKQLREVYLHIRICVVLAYLPTEKTAEEDLSDTMFPEIEGHPQFTIDRRNRWMLQSSDFCICYINHTWGGAFKFARLAKRCCKEAINIGSVEP